MDKREDRQLNHPVRKYFEKKLKCAVARNEFSFSSGKLDVLAYDRANKCFHICEGKRSSNVASVGHAIGQLIAYMSMIQEGGYDFLNRISEEERLELSDFTAFKENDSFNICFYVALPFENQEKLLNAAKLMLNNLGVYGRSIGVFFASNKKCVLPVQARPHSIKIRRVYNRADFLAEVSRKFSAAKESKGLVFYPVPYHHLIQFKKKDGNQFLHYEVWLRKKKKTEIGRTIEIGFHVEFTKEYERKKKLSNALSKAARELRRKKYNFKYEAKWGKNWSRVYTLHNINQAVLDDTVLDDVLKKLKALTSVSKPLLDKINWGRIRGSAIENT